MTRPRRDPRQDRAARRAAGTGTRPRFLIEAPAVPQRPRRDPRAEAARQRVPAPPCRVPSRLRLDRTQRDGVLQGRAQQGGAQQGGAQQGGAQHGGAAETAPPHAAVAAPQLRVVADPAFLVLAVPDATGGVLSGHDRQVLGAAHVLAGKAGAVVLLGPLSGEAARAVGADRIAPLPVPDGHAPDLRAAAIVAAIDALRPRHALFPESADGGDLARRVAALTGEALFGDVEVLTPRAAIRPASAGRMEQHRAPGRLLAVSLDRVLPYAGPPCEARLVDLPGQPALPPAAVMSSIDLPADPAALKLPEAGFVAAAGNGVTDFAAFGALAAALGATPGGSRVVCDAGLLPRDRQVGASGSVLTARCYLALGISGAPQHLQGVTEVQHVLAVNTDLHAAMIARAELAVVADAQAVTQAMLALLGGEGAAPVPAAADDPGSRGPSSTARRGMTADGGSAEGGAPGRGLGWSDPGTPRIAGAWNGPRREGLGLRAVVLLSSGLHRVSGRPAPVPVEMQAIRLARDLGAAVTGLHAGADGPALRDALGHGLDRLRLLEQAAGRDPLPALLRALRADTPDLVPDFGPDFGPELGPELGPDSMPDLVLAGRRGEGGEDAGMLPYRLAQALDWPILADAVALAAADGVLTAEQALPRGARRRVTLRLPCVVTVHPAAPAALPFAFAASRGAVDRVPAPATDAEEQRLVEERLVEQRPAEERPYRPRPRIMAAAAEGGGAAAGRRLLVGPPPEQAAAEILAHLRRIRVVPG